MIEIEKTVVFGFEAAIRGMRNPMNSWDKSDSFVLAHENGNLLNLQVGKNDLKLMQSLVKAGTDHSKFMRMINVTMNITAPLYWWKEFDTYKVGTIANSCSTMHKIHTKEFTINDFSHEHLTGETIGLWTNVDGRDYMCSAWDFCQITCDVLNRYREKYLETKDKKYWWQMIQLLPSSYNQKRTVQLNYQVLRNIYFSRKNHKLDEWVKFCDTIKQLPYAKELICLE